MQDEYRFLSELINQLWLKPGVTQLVLYYHFEKCNYFGEGGLDDPIEFFQCHHPRMQPEMIEDYLAKTTAGRAVVMEPRFELLVPYEFEYSDELGELLQNGGWPAFNQKFPGAPGMIGVSRVGFSRDRKQALTYAFLHGEHPARGVTQDILPDAPPIFDDGIFFGERLEDGSEFALENWKINPTVSTLISY